MRPPNAHLIGILSALLVLLCLSGSAAQPGGRQDQAGLKIVRKDDSINSQGGSEPTDYGYGPPPPYYSEEPTIAISTDSPYLPPGMPTSQTRTSMTGAGISSEIDGTSMMNVSVSSGDGTVSSGHSSTFVSTAMMTTDTSTVLAGSSAKASSATDSQTASTVHSTGSVASLISEATNGAIPSTTEGGSFDSTSDDGYSFSSTVSSFSGTEPTSDFTSPSDTTGLLTSASLISSSITPPRILTGSETFGEETSAPASSATSESASEATARWNGTSHMSDSSKSLSTDYPAPGQSTLGSSIAARSTTTTTWMTEATQSSDFSGTPSSSEVGTGSLSGLVSSTSLVESTTSMRPITTTTARFNITVTVSRSTSTEPATTLDESEPWPTSTLVTSVPVPVPSQTWSAITSMIIVSSFGDSSGTASAPASTPFITDTSAISLTPSSSSGSFDESGPVVSASLTQTSSSPLFDSSTLPVNTSTQASSMSATMITVTENSVITVFPGEVPPTGTATDVTNSSISTTYETVTSSQHNVSSVARGLSSSLSRTTLSLDWPTTTLGEPQTSGPSVRSTASVLSPSLSTSPFSRTSSPLFPPTWASTITTRITPTSFALSQTGVVTRTTDGYSSSGTAGSSLGTSGPLSTSIAGPSGFNLSTMSRGSTILPSPSLSNTTMDWQPTTSFWSSPQTSRIVTSERSDTTWSAISSGFNSSLPSGESSAVPWANTTRSERTSFPSSSPFSRVSDGSVATSHTLSATSTPYWPMNPTTTTRTSQMTVTSTLSQGPGWNFTQTRTWSGLSTGIASSGIASTVTPPYPISQNGTSSSTLGGSGIETPTGGPSATATPPFPLPWNSTIVPPPGSAPTSTFSIQTSLPPFPRPSNSTAGWTMTGTGISVPPTGTGPYPTASRTTARNSTTIPASTPGTSTPYHPPNTTISELSTWFSTPVPRTTTPLFPISNSTTITPLFPIPNSTTITPIIGTGISSSISLITPGPAPWTTWSTLSLTARPGSSTPIGVPPFPTANSTVTPPTPTFVTRTTTPLITSVPTGTATSRVSGGAISRTAWASSGIWSNTTIGTSGSSELSGPSGTARSSGPVTVPFSSRPAGTLTITIGDSTSSHETGDESPTDLTWGPSTTVTSSSWVPFPAENSTVSQASGRSTPVISSRSASWNTTSSCSTTTPASTTGSCESTSTASSTCTDSPYYPPYHPPPSTFPTTTNCSTASSRTAPVWPYPPPVPTGPGESSSACATAGSAMSATSCSTMRWMNATRTFAAKDPATYPPPTTLKTVTLPSFVESWSGSVAYPTPTGTKAPENEFPDNPNFPWGGDSPVHRHRNVSDLGIGTGDGGLGPRAEWRLRWENAVDGLKSLWHRHRDDPDSEE
ncbi:hypothetical protein ACJZ2D_002704 [Fusarium nematophilum]